MLVLDINMIREFLSASERGQRLRKRMQESAEDAALTVVSIEESMRGWLSELNRRTKNSHDQIQVYHRLHQSVEIFSKWAMFLWDVESADLFVKFRKAGARIGTLDLKIACIALAHDALLLTRNSVDFAQVPGLRYANWVD